MQATSAERNEGPAPALSAHEVENHILHRLGRRIRELHVEVGPDGLVLRGNAPTYYAKQIAQQTVMELGGLVRANAIEVG